MYINVAYVDDENPNLEDLTVPVRVNNCGYYRVHTGPVIETPHPEGRNDYQLLYIAAGKGYFYFKGSKEPTIVTKGNMVLFRPKEPQVYYYYAEDKTEVYWVHFTGWKIEQYLDSYELPKEENVFFTGVSPDYPWIYNQIIRELQLQRANYEDVIKLFLHHILSIVHSIFLFVYYNKSYQILLLVSFSYYLFILSMFLIFHKAYANLAILF